jgi:hypothetical protein
MTFASAITSRRFSLSANRLRTKRWPSPESSGSRDLERQESTTRVVRASQPQTWLPSALQRLSELANLEPGWDDASAPAISSVLIASVYDFLTSDLVASFKVEPDIVPTFEGKLLIEWHTESTDLIIEVVLDGISSFYFFNNETGEEVEAPLGQRLDAIKTAFDKLVNRG